MNLPYTLPRTFPGLGLLASYNHKTSNITDHAPSDQNHAVMMKEHAAVAKATNQPVTTYSPIAASLMVMDDAVKTKMKMKFDFCYLLAKKGIAC